MRRVCHEFRPAFTWLLGLSGCQGRATLPLTLSPWPARANWGGRDSLAGPAGLSAPVAAQAQGSWGGGCLLSSSRGKAGVPGQPLESNCFLDSDLKFSPARADAVRRHSQQTGIYLLIWGVFNFSRI